MNYREYLRSREWRDKRDRVMKREMWTCQRCGEPADHVHHLSYRRVYREDLDRDLQALCSPCHRFLHGLSRVDPARYRGNWIDLYLALLDEL
jgi:5-methylcytosine-specific restriction endonuclease McrA